LQKLESAAILKNKDDFEGIFFTSFFCQEWKVTATRRKGFKYFKVQYLRASDEFD